MPGSSNNSNNSNNNSNNNVSGISGSGGGSSSCGSKSSRSESSGKSVTQQSGRDRGQAIRDESRRIDDLANERSGFDYVVNPPDVPRVCFGSSLERDALPMGGKGLSPFMRRHVSEVRSFPGPYEYYVDPALQKAYNLTKPSLKDGLTSMFESKTPRLMQHKVSLYPPVGTYDVRPHLSFKESVKPFGVGAKRVDPEPFLTPGPPTYPIHLPPKKLNMSMIFGNARILWPSVAVFCAPTNTSICITCNRQPVGDYWYNFETKEDMCRACMRQKITVLKRCSTDLFVRLRKLRELENFAQVRYCDFYHDHGGTTIGKQILSTKMLHAKIKKENYLHRFPIK